MRHTLCYSTGPAMRWNVAASAPICKGQRTVLCALHHVVLPTGVQSYSQISAVHLNREVLHTGRVRVVALGW